MNVAAVGAGAAAHEVVTSADEYVSVGAGGVVTSSGESGVVYDAVALPPHMVALEHNER